MPFEQPPRRKVVNLFDWEALVSVEQGWPLVQVDGFKSMRSNRWPKNEINFGERKRVRTLVSPNSWNEKLHARAMPNET